MLPDAGRDVLLFFGILLAIVAVFARSMALKSAVVLVLMGMLVWATDDFHWPLAITDRLADLIRALFGVENRSLSRAIWFGSYVGVLLWSYWRESDGADVNKPWFLVVAKSLAQVFAILTLLNAAVYLAVFLVKGEVVTHVTEAFGMRRVYTFKSKDYPMLFLDPLLGTMAYAALRFFGRGKTSLDDRLRRGAMVLRDPHETMRAYQPKVATLEPNGVLLHPQLRMPLALETRHLLLVSAPGGGKTQVLFPMLADLMARSFPVILYDFKGDYTEAYGGADFATILSPFDARSPGWDVAHDVDTPMRAVEFAAQLLPHAKSREPFFLQAAQDLLTGVITKLQQERPGVWSLRDLVTVLADRRAVADACRDYRPAALNTLGDMNDKQAAGIFGALRTGTIQLEYLANAWEGSVERFSVRRWLRDRELRAAKRLVILKGDQQYRELDGFFTALMFGLVTKEVLAFPDSHDWRDSVWAFLDEFGNLPRIEGIDKLLTAVRSKGLRVVVAIQDIAQIEEAYSRPFAQTFFGAFGTVLAGLASGDTAAFLSRAFGQNQIERTLTSTTSSWETSSTTEAETVVVENALLDNEFASLEPPGFGRPASFWLKTAGWPIGLLHYPVKPTPKVYPATVPNDRLFAYHPALKQAPASAVTPMHPDVHSKPPASAEKLTRFEP
jgi:hypothetical protein